MSRIDHVVVADERDPVRRHAARRRARDRYAPFFIVTKAASARSTRRTSSSSKRSVVKPSETEEPWRSSKKNADLDIL